MKTKKKPLRLRIALSLRERKCSLCGRRNARYNGDKRPLCGHCFKKPNIG